MNKKIIIGSDHAGFALKEILKKELSEYDVEDIGVHNEESSDYPDQAKLVAQKVSAGEGRGILICGAGLGEVIVANKFKGVRATGCFNEYTAKMAREHNNSNILCLGARVIDEETAKKIAQVWLTTAFSDEERHHRRIDKITAIEKEQCK